MKDQHRKVSSEQEQLILVDREDREVGYLSKADAHDGKGVLHRAFSLFLFNDDGQLLLQQRAPDKRLWGGFWSNSCCSHPRRGESLDIATRRRLREELLCHVYLGRVSADVCPNDSEIAAIRYLGPDQLDEEFATRPGTVTPWFRQEWRELTSKYREKLRRYCALD
ncbi:MAG: NUDIX domain-containing protein [Woeseiaceae bacterium]